VGAENLTVAGRSAGGGWIHEKRGCWVCERVGGEGGGCDPKRRKESCEITGGGEPEGGGEGKRDDGGTMLGRGEGKAMFGGGGVVLLFRKGQRNGEILKKESGIGACGMSVRGELGSGLRYLWEGEKNLVLGIWERRSLNS